VKHGFTSTGMGIRGIFSRREQKRIILGVAKNIFLRGAKRGKISFYLLETKESAFFAKN